MDTFIAMQDRLWKTYQRRRRALVDIAAGASDGSTIPDIRLLLAAAHWERYSTF